MALNLNPGNYPDEPRATPTDVLDAVLKHVPLTVMVELVESRYRDRRNKFFCDSHSYCSDASCRVGCGCISGVYG